MFPFVCDYGGWVTLFKFDNPEIVVRNKDNTRAVVKSIQPFNWSGRKKLKELDDSLTYLMD